MKVQWNFDAVVLWAATAGSAACFYGLRGTGYTLAALASIYAVDILLNAGGRK